MAMRAVLLVMSLSTCWALRYLQGASDLSQHVKSVGGNSEGEDKGICMDLQGEARQRDSQKHLRLQQGEVCVCDWQDLFCDWVPAKWIPAPCEGKPEHPAHKGIFDFNRNEEMACKSQYMFCDWAPAKKVYE